MASEYNELLRRRRERAAAIVEIRKAQIVARVIQQLETSRAHEQLTPEERITLAHQTAAQAMSFDQPGFNFASGAEATSAWDADDPEVESARFKAMRSFFEE